MISAHQEQIIIETVSNSKIRNQSLKDDLIDHLCCLVEVHTRKGVGFKEALQASLVQTAPDGLDEIEKETIFLFNYSKIMFMKRLMFFSGYLFTLSWVVGLVMKALHLMGAGLIMALGAFGVAFIFIPLFLINRYKYIARDVLSERIKWILGCISMSIMIAAITMKLLHLMGAALLLVIGAFVFGFGFLPFLFFRMYKKSIDEL